MESHAICYKSPPPPFTLPTNILFHPSLNFLPTFSLLSRPPSHIHFHLLPSPPTTSYLFPIQLCRWLLSTIRGYNGHSMSTASTAKPKFVVLPIAKIFESSNVNPNLFRFTTAIAGMQFVLWCYLSYFALTQLQPIQGMENDKDLAPEEGSSLQQSAEDLSSERSKIGLERFKWLMSSKWRLSLSLLSLAAGSVFALVAYIYPLRLVRTLTYVRPTQTLKVLTHTPLGAEKEIEVPLMAVTCNTTQAQIAQGQSIALKVEGHSLFFMLNHKGVEISPMLRSLVLNRKN